MKFGFLVYPKMQLMDFVGPIEVLNFWRKLKPSLEIYCIAENLQLIDCGNGMTLQPDYTFLNAPQLDYLCVPGGPGRIDMMHNTLLLSFIHQQYVNCKLIAAICTGSFLLYKAGILRNHKVTTYWLALPELQNDPSIEISEERVVKSGKVWTSGGVSSGVDLIFELINEIDGKKIAGQVQLLFEYFPNNKIYCVNDDINKLPPYPNENSNVIRRLPSYIIEALKSET